jgi:glycosyltransferase involved in cell wall biosynthesis
VTNLIINGRFLCQRATGVQRVAREFVTALERLLDRGEFPLLRPVLVAPDGADFDQLGFLHIATTHLPGGSGYYWEQIVLPRYARRVPLLCLGNLAPVLSLIAGEQVAVMLHDQSWRSFPKDYSLSYRVAHRLIGALLVRRARPLVTVSQTEAMEIKHNNKGRPKNITVAPNGSWIGDQSPLRSASGVAARQGFVLHVGGFSDRKNVHGVFAAAKALAERGIETRLVGQPNDRVDAFLEPLGKVARSKISFTGYVDNSTLAELYQRAACLIYPSLYEASGLPPSEAMSFGCPVVVSDLPVFRERCEAAALYCDPHDHRSIVARVLEIIESPLYANEMSARGIVQAAKLTWENQARTIINAITNHSRGQIDQVR